MLQERKRKESRLRKTRSGDRREASSNIKKSQQVMGSLGVRMGFEKKQKQANK